MSAPLWTFAELMGAIGGRPVGPEPDIVTGISIDSRTIAPGDAFFAIAGEKFDGHGFVGQALARGAATAVVAEARLAGLGRHTGSLIVVEDVLAALRAAGAAARARTTARIVAVTGSVGKTSTKDMLGTALAGQGLVHGSPASFNNHWGVPLTLARLPVDAAFGVFEMGMNHFGEIAPLSQLARPHVAIITNVEPVHLAHFASVDEIAAAKAEIFIGLDPAGAALLNADNPRYELLRRMAEELGVGQIFSFGADPAADVRLVALDLASDGSTIEAEIFGQPIAYTLGVPGGHMVQNSLAVLAAAVLLGHDLAAAAANLGGYSAGRGRGEQTVLHLPAGKALLIDESYNANPASMRAALALLGQTVPGRNGRRLAVLGDMLELGPDELALHAGLATPIADAAVERTYLAGDRMNALWEALPADRRGVYAESAGALESALAADIRPGDVLVVKGSNATGMGLLVDSLKKRFGRGDPGQGVRQGTG